MAKDRPSADARDKDPLERDLHDMAGPDSADVFQLEVELQDLMEEDAVYFTRALRALFRCLLNYALHSCIFFVECLQ